MTWSYTGDPASSSKDAVRFAVGDTLAAKPLLSDEEINASLAMAQGNVQSAAVAACRGILFQLGRLRDESVGSVSISFSQQFDHYMALLGTLEGQLGIFGAFSVYAGGTSLSDSRNIVCDPDRIPPDFRKRRPVRWNDGIFEASPQANGDFGLQGEDGGCLED